MPLKTSAAGYDRSGLERMKELVGTQPVNMAVHTRNHSASDGPIVPKLPASDMVEIAVQVGKDGIPPSSTASAAVGDRFPDRRRSLPCTSGR